MRKSFILTCSIFSLGLALNLYMKPSKAEKTLSEKSQVLKPESQDEMDSHSLVDSHKSSSEHQNKEPNNGDLLIFKKNIGLENIDLSVFQGKAYEKPLLSYLSHMNTQQTNMILLEFRSRLLDLMSGHGFFNGSIPLGSVMDGIFTLLSYRHGEQFIMNAIKKDLDKLKKGFIHPQLWIQNVKDHSVVLEKIFKSQENIITNETSGKEVNPPEISSVIDESDENKNNEEGVDNHNDISIEKDDVSEGKDDVSENREKPERDDIDMDVTDSESKTLLSADEVESSSTFEKEKGYQGSKIPSLNEGASEGENEGASEGENEGASETESGAET
jgi:hypothetical protein